MAQKIQVTRQGMTRCPACQQHIRLAARAVETACPFCGEGLPTASARPLSLGLRGGLLVGALLGWGGCAADAAQAPPGVTRTPPPVVEAAGRAEVGGASEVRLAQAGQSQPAYGVSPIEVTPPIDPTPPDDDDSADDGADDDSADDGSADDGSADDGSADDGSAGDGSTTTPPRPVYGLAPIEAPLDGELIPAPSGDGAPEGEGEQGADGAQDGDEALEVEEAPSYPPMARYGLPPMEEAWDAPSPRIE